DALCRSFLPKVRDESVSVRVGAEFTCSEAQAHNIIGIVIDHIFGAQEEWIASESAFTQNVIDLRVGSDHTRCLDVERSLAFFAIESRIFAVDDDVQVFRREPKKRAIRVDVRTGNVREANDGDFSAGAIQSRGRNIVDSGEVAGSDSEEVL